MVLTEKQKLFCDEYLIDLNATRAYRTVYKNCKKDETAAAAGARALRNVNVKAYLDVKMQERAERTEITQDKVLKELAAIAFANGADYAQVVERQATYTTEDGIRIPVTMENGTPVMTEDVELTLTNTLTDIQKKAISSIKQGKNGIEIATCDKVKALELLGRHLGMFKDKVEVSGLDAEKNKLDNILKQMRGDG